MHDTSTFIHKANKIHNNKYDYSKVKYINSRTKIVIICPEHGEFNQTPNNHIIDKKGCPKCAGNYPLNTNEFIKRATNKHNNKYDYSKVKYVNSTTKITIICTVHGEFNQTPQGHLKGYGCPSCTKNSKLGKNRFIHKANKIHNNKYDYSKVKYSTTKSKIIIICPIHGEFTQLPLNHLYNKNGCPYCLYQESSGQKEISDWIESFNITVIRNDRKVIKPNELDIFIPSKNLAIEYNGIYFHSYNSQVSNKQKNYHKNKFLLCVNRGIELIQITEYEWNNKKDIIKSIILNKLKPAPNIIHSNKCHIKSITTKEFNEFCVINSVQEPPYSEIKLGLCYNSMLVQILGVNRHQKHLFECSLTCTLINHEIIGGIEKLFSKFVNEFNTSTILASVDAKFPTTIYEKLGFKLCNHANPDYCYVKGKKCYNKNLFQNNTLRNKLKTFDKSENMFRNGYRVLYDAGQLNYIWNIDTHLPPGKPEGQMRNHQFYPTRLLRAIREALDCCGGHRHGCQRQLQLLLPARNDRGECQQYVSGSRS